MVLERTCVRSWFGKERDSPSKLKVFQEERKTMMNLQKAKELATACFCDPEISRLYQAGDQMSHNQTKHDLDHANQVMDLANKVARGLVARDAGALDDWTREVVIPLAAFLHDVGRAIDVADHARAGATWARAYLGRLTLEGDSETLPVEVIERICKIIACHRSSAVLKQDFDDPAWAIVVIADKCVGDEDRVRPEQAAILAVLTWFRLAWIPLRKGGVHDRATFAIKKAELNVGDGNLRLSIALDERVCKPKLVYELYGERFWACVKAARYLGYGFELEFNGVGYSYDSERKAWKSQLSCSK